MLKLKLQYFRTWCEALTHWKRAWCWERLKSEGEGDNRGWDGWMASLTWWTWVWASSGSWWWTGKPGMLQSMGSQRVRHNWVTEQPVIFLIFEKLYTIFQNGYTNLQSHQQCMNNPFSSTPSSTHLFFLFDSSHYNFILTVVLGFPCGSAAKNLPAMRETQEMRVWYLSQEYPRRRKWHPAPVFLHTLWFLFSLSWWLIMLSDFSYTCWPFLYLPLTNVYSVHFPIFNWII